MGLPNDTYWKKALDANRAVGDGELKTLEEWYRMLNKRGHNRIAIRSLVFSAGFLWALGTFGILNIRLSDGERPCLEQYVYEG